MLFDLGELELCAFKSMVATESHSFQCIHSNPLLSECLHNIFMNYECVFQGKEW